MTTQTVDSAPIEPDDERRHPHSDELGWQESVCCWFLNSTTNTGGFFRFGIHPADGYGRLNLFTFSDSTRFRRVNERVPLKPIDEAPELRVGSAAASVDPDQNAIIYCWAEPECEADLRFLGFHPPLGFGGQAHHNLQQGVYAGHLEASGRLIGTIRIGDSKVDINALAHRDRSWGPRRIDVVHTNRMFSGTMGPALSFAANVIQTKDGTANVVGHIVRDGQAEPVVDAEILPAIHLDGYSVAGGTARLQLKSSELITIHAETIAGQLTPWDSYLTSDHISRAWSGDLEGFCDNELTNNPRSGVEPPSFLQYVDGGDGLSQLPARPF